MMTIDQAIQHMRNTPKYADLVRDAYFDRDVLASGERFLNSAEFGEVRALIGRPLHGLTVVDVGAGTGISSYAFAKSGAKHVYAVEPDPSDEVGRGAIARLSPGLPITLLDALADRIPLETASADIVYVRQVLHHIPDLPAAMKEFARILKPGGLMIACREHVVDNAEQMAIFLAKHPMHQLAGGENAYPLNKYLDAIRSSGLTLRRCIGPWGSVINAFPAMRTTEELQAYPEKLLRAKIGGLAKLAIAIPGLKALILRRIDRPVPGRMYSFIATR